MVDAFCLYTVDTAPINRAGLLSTRQAERVQDLRHTAMMMIMIIIIITTTCLPLK